MKKSIILCAVSLLGLSASAQLQVLKDAERSMKDKASMAKVIEVVTPAFTNPETKDMAQTYYIPGKAAFNEYDNLFSLKAFNRLPAGGQSTMGQNLVEGYEFFTKALSLDSVPDAKGKIKTKYSKDILSTLAGHYNDFNNNAIELYNSQEYPAAYKAWTIYLDMSYNPERYKGINVPNDTLLSEITYNQGLAAYQAKDLKGSLEAFIKAKDRGYDKQQIYDFAISVAAELGDSATILALANEALPKYGKENPYYIQVIINDLLTKKDFVSARNAINDAIASDPNNAEYYVVLGVIYENEGNRKEAQGAYKKALELNGESEFANYYYGKSLCEDAYAASDKSPSDQNQIEEYFNTNIKPLFQEAAIYLEKANQINPDNLDVLKYLENVYYNLKDEKMLEDVQNRRLQ